MRLSAAEPPVFSGESRRNPSYILFSYFLGFFQFGIYGELGTNKTAQAAIDTIFGLKHKFRRVVALFVEPVTGLQAFVRTKFNTETATFAATFNYANFALRYRMRLRVQGQSPEFHIGQLQSVKRYNLHSIAIFLQESNPVATQPRKSTFNRGWCF